MKLDGIRQQVFLDRYSLKDKKGRSLEKTPEETWRRVARGIASVEKKQARKFWEKKFYQAMEGFKFVPGGRVLAGAGTNFAVTFYNCFVLPSPPDSRDGILDNLKAMIEIMARGGGVGINLSSLRPKGSRVRKVNGFSSGPCNWAELYSLATHDIIQQGGCFTGDTKIMTHLGLVPVGEIINNSRNWYAVTHRGYRKVTGKFDNGVKTVFEVKTKGGYGLRVTGEHRLVTVDASGHFYLKKLADFRIGEQVVLLLGDWLADIPHVQLKTNIPAPSKHSFGRAKITLPKVLDENLAFVIGVYDADGSKVKDKYASNGKGLRIAVAGDRQKDLEKLKEVTKELFGMSPITSKGDGAVYNLSIYSREVNEFLALNELLKQSSVTVAVPVLIFSSPKSVVEAYIAGVFFGDGSNRGGKGGLRITTVSANFASQIQLLLLNLGIAAKIKTQQRPQKNWRTIYTVTINGNRFMEKFAKIVSSYTEKVNDHTISSRDGAFNWPFNLTEKFAYLSGFQRTIARTNPTTSQKAALFLAQRLPMIRDEDYEDVEFLSTCVPDTIASIEKRGEERVYDLEVDDVHLLSGNGFYTSNSRRGALMLMLWDWHPDIEEFITVKQDLRRINGANLSVCVSDKFMEAVKNDSDWDLVFPDMNDKEYDEEWDGILEHWRKLGKKVKRYKTLKARYLWDLICGGAWRSAEPGIVFMERYNKWYNNWYWNTVNCVNPCVTGDTLVATEFGWVKAKDLTVGTKILTPKGLKPIDKIYNNGVQKIFEVVFSDGGNLEATADHKLRVVRNKKFEWVKVINLKKGDQVVVVSRTSIPQARTSIPQKALEYAKRNNLRLNGGYDRELGFLIGVTIGDGYFGKIGQELGYRMKLCFGMKEEQWGKVLVQTLQKFGTEPRVVSIEHRVPYEDGSIGVHGSKQISLYKLANVLGLSGLAPKTGPQKEVPYELLNLGEDFQKGLLDGLFSTDGSVSMKTHDPMLRLSSSSKTLLEQVRLLLFNFGIHSRIYEFKRRHARYDGRDMIGTGVKYDLLIMNEGIARFYEFVGLSHPEKAERLKTVAQKYYFMGGTNLARVVSVRDTRREEEVYDVHEPETLTWITNGYISLDCGEEGLPAWGVCNLGSLNLSAFVKGYSVDKPGEMDYASLAKHAKIAVRFQDDVVDADQYIFPEIEQMQLQGERRIGLGTMGLGDALIKMHLRYGGEESIPVIEKIFKTIRDAAYEVSIEIAREKKPFPKFVASKHLEGYFVKQLPKEIRQKMKKYGIRNSVLLQEAPTGTTSLLAGVSSGIEPVYEFEFIRRDRLGEHLMYHPLYEEWKESHANDSPAGKKPDYFVSANDLTPEEHVRVQAAVQKYVDASISKTVNAPKAHTIEDVKKLYTLAYELGCKGITYMREGSREGVLSRLETRQKEEKEAPQSVVSGQIIPVNGIAVIPRPMKLDGATYKMVTPIGPTFVTINHDEEGNPFEVFITIGKSGSDVSAMAEALGRLISLNLRAQATVSPLEKVGQVVEQLSGIGGFRAVGFGQNRVRSLPDAVSKILAMHFGIKTQNGNGTEMAKPAEIKSLQPLPFEEKESLMDICPECGSAALALEEGCRKCYGCGYSEC